MKTIFTKRIKLGQVDGENIYLSAPSWNCGWHWGFGYLGNNNCHYHLDGLMKNTNLYEGIKKHFDSNTFIIKDDQALWTFCELIKNFYVLKESAEVFGRGGSHYTKNPISELITDKKKADEINQIILPSLFNEIYKIINK